MSATLFTRRAPLVIHGDIAMPSIFITLRAAKCRMLSRSLAGHCVDAAMVGFAFRANNMAAAFGQDFGIWKSLSRADAAVFDDFGHFGITSPPRLYFDPVAIFTPRRSMKSML